MNFIGDSLLHLIITINTLDVHSYIVFFPFIWVDVTFEIWMNAFVWGLYLFMLLFSISFSFSFFLLTRVACLSRLVVNAFTSLNGILFYISFLSKKKFNRWDLSHLTCRRLWSWQSFFFDFHLCFILSETACLTISRSSFFFSINNCY